MHRIKADVAYVGYPRVRPRQPITDAIRNLSLRSSWMRAEVAINVSADEETPIAGTINTKAGTRTFRVSDGRLMNDVARLETIDGKPTIVDYQGGDRDSLDEALAAMKKASSPDRERPDEETRLLLMQHFSPDKVMIAQIAGACSTWIAIDDVVYAPTPIPHLSYWSILDTGASLHISEPAAGGFCFGLDQGELIDGYRTLRKRLGRTLEGKNPASKPPKPVDLPEMDIRIPSAFKHDWVQETAVAQLRSLVSLANHNAFSSLVRQVCSPVFRQIITQAAAFVSELPHAHDQAAAMLCRIVERVHELSDTDRKAFPSVVETSADWIAYLQIMDRDFDVVAAGRPRLELTNRQGSRWFGLKFDGGEAPLAESAFQIAKDAWSHRHELEPHSRAIDHLLDRAEAIVEAFEIDLGWLDTLDDPERFWTKGEGRPAIIVEACTGGRWATDLHVRVYPSPQENPEEAAFALRTFDGVIHPMPGRPDTIVNLKDGMAFLEERTSPMNTLDEMTCDLNALIANGYERLVRRIETRFPVIRACDLAPVQETRRFGDRVLHLRWRTPEMVLEEAAERKSQTHLKLMDRMGDRAQDLGSMILEFREGAVFQKTVMEAFRKAGFVVRSGPALQQLFDECLEALDAIKPNWRTETIPTTNRRR